LPVTLTPRTKTNVGDIFSQNKCDIRTVAWDKTLKKTSPKNTLYLFGQRGRGAEALTINASC
jgi:hypothetical protein